MTTSSYDRLSHSRWDCKYHVVFVPTKYAVAEVIGYLKGKSAISMARQFSGRKLNYNGESFWTRGYSVSTVGYDQENVRVYIEKQEKLDKSC